jgi:hypothetical protein
MFSQAFTSRHWGVSLFSGFMVLAGKAIHQGWWRCMAALRFRQV